MKKLVLLALVASVVAQFQVRADKTSDTKTDSESSASENYAIWPACFAVAEWPETPC